MTDEQISSMLLEVVEELDYDQYKALLPATAEEPDTARQRLFTLVDIVRSHMDKARDDERTASSFKLAYAPLEAACNAFEASKDDDGMELRRANRWARQICLYAPLNPEQLGELQGLIVRAERLFTSRTR